MNSIALLILFNSTTVQFNLPNNLLQSICYIESKHNISAVHKDDGNSDSLGVCQIKLETAKWLGFKGSKKELMLPEVNLYYSAKYLRYNLDRYNGNTIKAIISYNKGNAKNLKTSKYYNKVNKEQMRWF